MDVPASTSAHQAALTWKDGVALIASYLINPLCMPVLGIGLVLWHFGAPASETLMLSGLAFVCFCLIPLVYILIRMKQGKIEALDVPNRSNRTGVLWIGLVSLGFGLILMRSLGTTAVPVVTLMMTAYWLNTGLLLCINAFWKISIHLIGLSGVLATFLFVAHTPWPAELLVGDEPSRLEVTWIYASFVLLPFLMWTRVHLNAHTIAQVVVGAVVGLVGQYGALYALHHFL